MIARAITAGRVIGMRRGCTVVFVSLLCLFLCTGRTEEASPAYAELHRAAGFSQLWVWDTLALEDETVFSEFIRMLAEGGFTTVFLNVGVLAEYGELHLTARPDLFAALLQACHANDIAVEALFGAPAWATAAFSHDMLLQVKAVFEFNCEYGRRFLLQTGRVQFDGLHLDIEPQGLDGKSADIPYRWHWGERPGPAEQEENRALLRQWLNNMRLLRRTVDVHNRQNRDDLIINLDINPWLSENHLYRDLYSEIIPCADRITLMLYTSDAEMFVRQGEAFLRNWQALNRPVVCGVELQKEWGGNLFAFTPEELSGFLAQAGETFRKYPDFAGYAVHNYRAYREYIRRYPAFN